MPAVPVTGAGEGAPLLPGRSLPRVEVALRALVVAASLGAIVLSLVLEPTSGSTGHLSLGGFRLPGLCAFYGLTGLPCPGCGLTRSWVSAVHGDLAGSAAHHPLGWLVLLYAVAQGVRHAAWLALPARRRNVERLGARLDRAVLVLGALLFLAWLPRVTALLLGA